MASKSAQEPEKAEVIEEQLEAAEKLLDRVKVLYEQYFLGIQKQPPTHLHNDVERKLRDLSQIQIRNTALRYRFATAQQKFGSYHSYWRRTLRQIELGTYARNLAKIGRAAVRSGEDVPEEILAAMPKRMREQIRRDREAALALEAARRRRTPTGAPELASTGENDVDIAAFIREPSELRRRAVARNGAHLIDPSDAEMDLSAFFAEVASTAAEGREHLHDDDDRKTTEMPPLGRASTRPAVGPPVPIERAPTQKQPALERPVLRHDVPVGPQVAPRRPLAPAVPPQSTAHPVAPNVAAATGPIPGAIKRPSSPAMQPVRPVIPSIPSIPRPPTSFAPSQQARPLPITPGASAVRPPEPVESLKGPFERPKTGAMPPIAATAPAPPPRPAPVRPPAPARQAPPPGMTDADVNALYAKYVKAKEAVGEPAGPGAREKLLKTIHAQAPKIMEQYKAKGVDFSVVVKDNQVVIRAKPKT